MKPYPSCFDDMLAGWNEPDPAAIRAHLDRALAEDVEFIDPTIETHGIAEFEQNVRAFRHKYPGARCLRTSGFDAHHRLYRYTWEIRVGEQLIVSGFDVAELDASNQVRRVLGFFGPLPPLAG